jgi:hypothetical protein
MVKRELGLGRGVRWRSLLIAACAGVATLWTSAANATITQGDFSVFGFFESRESGRWGEGGAKDGTGIPASVTPGGVILAPGRAATESGGSFEFNHWDLVQARQLADVRPDYHIVKNYKMLGRFDTIVLKDADFFAFYRPWYDAFGSLKQFGRAEPNRNWPEFTQRDLQNNFFRDDLREYYAQLNFTDNFSARVGKQQVIWSEADALSGTEVTNPADLRYHWTHFESAENQRKNVRMVKLNYILPDFLKTANNEAEAFWIPGDYQGDTVAVNISDARSPWIVYAPESAGTDYNRFGQPFRHQTFADEGFENNSLTPVPVAPGVTIPFLTQFDVVAKGQFPRNAILKNSEFGARYSTLLPIGSGLQTSFIYLYEMRDSKTGLCSSCSTPSGFVTAPNGTRSRVKYLKVDPGVFLGVGQFDFGPPPPGGPIPLGTVRVETSVNYRKNHFFGITGTYYDKDLTDIVYRYDTLYAPKTGINQAFHHQAGTARSVKLGTSASTWTEQAKFIIAGDRPTYIPWISKQHTFLTWQYVNTWYPDLPDAALANLADSAGKVRGVNNLFFVAATNWLDNGQLTATNVFIWDVDDRVGFASSTNVFRYSRNILLGLNAIWYLGQSGRYTDPFLFSRDQRINEIEATFSYEI